MPSIDSNIYQTKTCPVSRTEFTITDTDIQFLEKVSPVINEKKYQIPVPTLCPPERQRRRLAWRNERNLYKRTCDLSGKELISNVAPHHPFPVYEKKLWFGDDYDPSNFGRNFNFDRPFFDQFHELQKMVPRFSIQQQEPIENSPYCNCVSHMRSSYFLFDSDNCEKSMYSNLLKDSKDCYDCSFVSGSEHCYECIDCLNSNELFFSSNCDNCRSSYFLENCIGCKNCAFCTNMRGGSYCFRNEQLSKDEYEKKVSAMKSDLDTHKLRGILKNFSEKYPKKAIHGTQNENVSGQYISNSKNVHESYNIRECWDISYCDRMAHAKNCMDISSLGEGLEWAYDSVSIGINTNNCLFSFTAVINCQNVMYCDTAYSAKNAFGCVCLKQSENMILNKSYTKHEYDQKVGKIIDHMMSAGEWGEFFPLNISPFDYHESVAAEQYSLSRDEAQKLSVNWSHDPEIKGFSGAEYRPLAITSYDEGGAGVEEAQNNIDEALAGVIVCDITGKPFKLQKRELAFYIENKLPIPTRCPDQRHKERMGLRFGQTIKVGTCRGCSCEISTTHDLHSANPILCEGCFASATT